MPQPQLLELFAESHEPRVTDMALQPMNDLDLDLLGSLGIGRLKNLVEEVGVEDKGVEVVADRVNVNVFVYQVNGLGPQRVPEEFALTARRSQRLVDLSHPAIVNCELLKDWVRRQCLPVAR